MVVLACSAFMQQGPLSSCCRSPRRPAAHALLARPAWQVKAAGGAPRPAVRFNRLLLRFPALHDGFAAARAVFRQLAGSDAGELNQQQMRGACAQLGYHLDDAAFDRIFGAADMDGSSTL